jgi:hypothetical protein
VTEQIKLSGWLIEPLQTLQKIFARNELSGSFPIATAFCLSRFRHGFSSRNLARGRRIATNAAASN